MRTDKKFAQKAEKKVPPRTHKRGVVGYSKKSALLEEAIAHMNTGKYGRSSAALKELLALDPHNTEARRLFATLHLRLGSLVTARQAFESLANEAIGRQDYWLAESLLREYLAAGPRCVPFLELLAYVYKEKGDEMAAVGELAKAINILVEDPDTDNPQKPAQLYAKIRELAPVSPSAFQLASLFDIQTGEFIAPHALAPPSSLPPETLTLSSPTNESQAAGPQEASEPMPWERIDPIPPHEPATAAPPAAHSLEQLNGSLTEAPPDSTSRESAQAGTPVDSLNLENRLLVESEPTKTVEEPAAAPITESLPPPFERQDWENLLRQPADQITSGSSEQPASNGASSMSLLVDEPASPSPLGSTSLSSPMPWEQIEHNTIPIQEVEPPPVVLPQPEPISFTVPPVPEPAPSVQLESVEDTAPSPAAPLVSPTSATIEPEAPVADIAPEAVHSDQPVSSASVEHAPAGTSFSWNAIFDGIWKFGAATSAPGTPTTLSQAETPESDAAVSEDSPTVPEPSHRGSISEPTETVQTLTSTTESFAAVVDTEPPPAPSPDTVSSRPTTERDAPSPVSSQPEPAAVLQEPGGLPPGFQYAPPVETTDFFATVAIAPVVEAPPREVPSFQASPGESEREIAAPLIEPPVVSSTISAASSTPANEPVVSVDAAPQAISPPSLDETIPVPPSMSPKPTPTSHWSTGEVAVQTHRPSKKKKRWDKEREETATESTIPTYEDKIETAGEAFAEWNSAPAETVVPFEEAPIPAEDTRPEWARASDAITFADVIPPLVSAIPTQTGELHHTSPDTHCSSAVESAVDVLFTSTASRVQRSTQERPLSLIPRPRLMARVARVRQGFSIFIGSCFSTTRAMVISLVVLVVACAGAVVAGVAAVGLSWLVMEEPPSSTYQNLAVTPARTINDPSKNGYFLLLGFDVPGMRDAVQAGYERKVDEHDRAAAAACLSGDTGQGDASAAGASAAVLRGWFASANPLEQMKGKGESLRMWAAEQSVAVGRYQQWLKMSFDDWGYGQVLSPNCAQILHIHRLYLGEGFSQDFPTGIERLEADMGAWRAALAQSKTLMVKMLAAAAIQDDVALASSLLVRSDLDETTLGRLGKIVRPLDQVEQSLRWPMQSHLVWASKDVAASIKHGKAELPLHVSLLAAMSLPIQRRANAYAEYYEAANKSVAEGRYTNLPKLATFVRTQGTSLLDYLANPIEHILGIEPMPTWDPYVGRIVEADARLRLASLQLWIRRGPQEGELLARLAKAGQAHFDPFTGLPMLVNQQKGLLYSVGMDGKDQDGDPVRDVVARVPQVQSGGGHSKRTTLAANTK